MNSFFKKKRIFGHKDSYFLKRIAQKKSKFKSGFRHISIPDCSRLRSIKRFIYLFCFGQILKMGCHLVNYIPLGMLATDIKSINTLNIPTSPSVCTVATKCQGFFLVAKFCQLATKEKKEGCHRYVERKFFGIKRA